MDYKEQIQEAAKVLSRSQRIVAFTGAGTSAESGIPPFRGEGGLWNKYDPNSLDIDFFYQHPEKSWEVIRAVFYDFFANTNIKPNPGHLILAKWEKEGHLEAVITQNIDDLHRIAGNKTVYEFHGNSSRFVCTKCGKVFPVKDVPITKEPPKCPSCGGLLKPDFIFFGEGIPEDAYHNSIKAAENCDAFVIVGTSGQVSPANMIPGIAKRNGAKIIEINREPSTYTRYTTDIYIEGKSGEILPEIDALIRWM